MSLNFVNTFNGFKFWFGLAVLLYLIIALVVRSKRPKTPVWSIMAFSSFMAVVFGLVGVDEVISAVDLDVILFLIGMFSLVSLANSSGLLEMLTLWFISAFRRRVALLYGSALLFGLLAAFVVNDTVALMGPPIAYTMSRLSGVDPRLMFLLLAFSLTIGSVMTPIGNPQNMLIAVESGVEAPFIRFLAKLALPTILNLVITTYIMVRMFRVEDKEINAGLIPHEALRNKRDATLAALGIILTIILLLANDVLELYGAPHIRYEV
jgi:Na+/H+ antiporter NhaD/arsenite permease-like protein